jgi:hypothetical protein
MSLPSIRPIGTFARTECQRAAPKFMVDDSYQAPAFLYFNLTQTSRPSTFTVKSVDTTHGNIITKMSTERPSITELNGRSAK